MNKGLFFFSAFVLFVFFIATGSTLPAGTSAPVIVIDGRYYNEGQVRELQEERSAVYRQLITAMQGAITQTINDFFDYALKNAGSLDKLDNAGIPPDTLFEIIETYAEEIESLQNLYLLKLETIRFKDNHDYLNPLKTSGLSGFSIPYHIVQYQGAFEDFFPPLTIPVVRLDEDFYSAAAVAALQKAMTKVSDTLWPQAKKEITAAMDTITQTRIRNITPCLDWWYGWLNSYIKTAKEITKTIDEYQITNFEKYLERGVDTGALVSTVNRYDDITLRFGNLFTYFLGESAVYNEDIIAAVQETNEVKEITAEDFFAPYMLAHKINSVEAELGLEINGRQSGVVGRLLNGAALVFTAKEAVDASRAIKTALDAIRGIKMAGASKLAAPLTGHLGKKLAVKIIGSKVFIAAITKLAAATGSKALGRLAATLSGGAGGALIGGPFGAAIGAVGGLIGAVFFDYGAVKLDELINRGDLQAELQSIVRAEHNALLQSMN